jgi:hypothetical protein
VLAELAQLVINGVVAGTVLAVPAIGFTAIYAVLKLPNFAVASLCTIGAFAGYVANTSLGVPAWATVIAAFVVAGLVGVVTDEVVLKPLGPPATSPSPSPRWRSPSRSRTWCASSGATTCAASTCRSSATGASATSASARSRSRTSSSPSSP